MKFTSILSFIPYKTAYAHCDIPCGIYDPHQAQVAAHTVIRMTQMIGELKYEDNIQSKRQFASQMARLTRVKEEHAEIVKHEIRVIWGDYFKEENMKGIKNLHEKVFNIMKLASTARQEANIKAANDLLSAVQEFSEIFYKSKGLTSIRIPSGYPTGQELVSHK